MLEHSAAGPSGHEAGQRAHHLPCYAHALSDGLSSPLNGGL